MPSTRWCAPASSSPAASVRRSVLSPGVQSPLVRRGRGLDPHERRRGRPQRHRAPRDPRQERAHPSRARRSASTPRPTKRRFTVSDGGVVVVGKGQVVEAERAPAPRERRAAHPRVPARGLRRRGRPRRVPGARAEPPDRRDRPRLGTEREAPTPPVRAYPAWEALAAARRIWPRCGRCRSTWRWPRASRAPTSSTATPGTRTSPATWPSCLRHPARGHRSQPRAAAPLEGRAARRRLRAVVVLRAHRAGGRRRDHRRVRGHARATCSRAIRRSIPARVHGRPQRRRLRGVPRPTAAPTCSSVTASTRRGRSSSSSGGSPARRACRICCDAARGFDPEAQLVLCARRARHRRRSPPRSAALTEALQAERGSVVWIEEMLPRPTSSSS